MEALIPLCSYGKLPYYENFYWKKRTSILSLLVQEALVLREFGTRDIQFYVC